jgi:hypothetical protein
LLLDLLEDKVHAVRLLLPPLVSQQIQRQRKIVVVRNVVLA